MGVVMWWCGSVWLRLCVLSLMWGKAVWSSVPTGVLPQVMYGTYSTTYVGPSDVFWIWQERRYQVPLCPLPGVYFPFWYSCQRLTPSLCAR